MKKQIILNEKIDIPDIVNDKCNMAYEQIRANAKPCAKKIHFKKKLVIPAVAAAAVLACGIPVTAAFFRNGFEFVSHEVYTKDPVNKNNLSAFAKPVNDENKQLAANITMQSVYCDGENLSVAFMLQPNNDELKRMTSIQATIKTYLNGERIDRTYENEVNYPALSLTADENGVFYGTMYYTGLNVTDASKLEISIFNLRGNNAKLMTYNHVGSVYEPEKSDVYSDTFNFDTTVSADTSNNTCYTINDKQDDITLEKVLITPFKTTVYLTGLGERQSLRVVDQNGEALEAMPVYTEDELIKNEFEHKYVFASPLKTAKSLSVQIFDLDTDNFPTQYEFKFDIDKGFTDKYDVPYDNSDVVYVPPIEELDKQEEEAEKKRINGMIEAAEKADKIPLNTPFEQEYYIDADAATEKMLLSWKVTGSNIGDVNADDVSEIRWQWYYDFSDLTTENSKMLFITYELTNTTDKTGSIYINGGPWVYSKDFELSWSEYDYVSDKDNGGKSSFKYDFEPNQTKTITLGYVIPEEYANDDFYVICTTDEVNSNNILDGDVKLMEIK